MIALLSAEMSHPENAHAEYMFAVVKRLVPQPRPLYIGYVQKRAKRALRILFYSIIGLAVFSFLFFLWFTRSPTTQLIDASGKELTAGNAVKGEQEAFAGSLFEDAQALIKRKEFAAAKERLLRVIEESDRDGEACILLCNVSRELKDVDAAADYGLKAVELLPGNAEAHLSYAKALGAQLAAEMQSIGGMLSAMKRLGLFKAELNRVIELNPQDTEARSMLVFTNMAPKPMGDIERAIELCGEIEARDPVMGKQLLAMCYQRKKETARALTLLLAGIEEYPEEYSFHVALADIYAEEKRFDAADAEYEAARRGGKGKAYYRSLYSQARMRIQNQFEPARAVELLDEFIMGEPESDGMQSVAHACWRKGNALEQLGRKQDAREAYQESLRRDPGLELAKKAIKDLQK
ncbi:MAG: tetratricopeptide repeat protein [Planctomycetota bacterium]